MYLFNVIIYYHVLHTTCLGRRSRATPLQLINHGGTNVQNIMNHAMSESLDFMTQIDGSNGNNPQVDSFPPLFDDDEPDREPTGVTEAQGRFYLAPVTSSAVKASDNNKPSLGDESPSGSSRFEEDTQRVNSEPSEGQYNGPGIYSSPLFTANQRSLPDLGAFVAESPPKSDEKVYSMQDTSKLTSTDRMRVDSQLSDVSDDQTQSVQMDQQATQPVNQAPGEQTIRPGTRIMQFRTPVVKKFLVPTDDVSEDDSTQRVTVPPPSTEKIVRNILSTGRPITQVMGTPFVDSQLKSRLDQDSSTPTSGTHSSNDKEVTIRRISMISEAFDETETPLAGRIETIVSDQETEPRPGGRKDDERSVQSSGEIIKSSPDKSQQPRKIKRPRKGSSYSSSSSPNAKRAKWPDEAKSSPKTKSLYRATPSPAKNKPLSPGFTPGHSHIRMPYFDEPGERTPTKIRRDKRSIPLYDEDGDDEGEGANLNDTKTHTASRNLLSEMGYNETGVWLPWNDGKWWVVQVTDGAPRGVATIFEPGAASSSLTLIDTSENETKVSSDCVKRLDIRAGDKIKILSDKRPLYEVVELIKGDPITPDIRSFGGYNYVKIKTIQAANKKTEQEEEPLVVALGDIYMTSNLVVQYLASRQQAKVLYQPKLSMVATQLEPSEFGNHERRKASTFAEISGNYREQSVSVSLGEIALGNEKEVGASIYDEQPRGGIFADCVFAVSSIPGSDYETLKKCILKNGGVICANGLRDLLTIDYGQFKVNWNSKIPKKRFRFGAVISAGVLRTPKYLEAVALGWPTLSWRFIDDCIRSEELLDWNGYALAAGLSEALDNNPRSHDLSHFNSRWREDADLEEQFSLRNKLLQGVSTPIYLIDRIPGKEDAVKLFLLLMGASSVFFVKKTSEVPKGSIVIDPSVKTESQSGKDGTARSYTHYWKYVKLICDEGKSQLPESIHYNREWVIQCVINGRWV